MYILKGNLKYYLRNTEISEQHNRYNDVFKLEMQLKNRKHNLPCTFTYQNIMQKKVKLNSNAEFKF